MDSQPEEYRHKQREQAASTTAASEKTCALNLFSRLMAGTALVIPMLAAVSLQQVPQGALGMVSHSPGACPKANGVGICVEECSGDEQCRAQGKLCCSNGCGHVCMTPVDPNAPAPARPCTLMVVPVSINSSAKLMTRVPKPESHSVLRGVGILILNYGKGRDGDCCQAKEWLSQSDKVKSVENDGPAPACPPKVMVAQAPTPLPEPELKPSKPQLAGGWSDEKKVEEEDLTVWNQVLAKNPRHEDVELGALGAPLTVRTQVVAGTNYRFKFADGTVVQVFSQPWTDTLEVTSVEPGSGGS